MIFVHGFSTKYKWKRLNAATLAMFNTQNVATVAMFNTTNTATHIVAPNWVRHRKSKEAIGSHGGAIWNHMEPQGANRSHRDL